jgi:hypothetical protein
LMSRQVRKYRRSLYSHNSWSFKEAQPWEGRITITGESGIRKG